MSDQNKCQGCGVTATWRDGKPFDVLVATNYDESARNVIWSCTDCIFLSGLGEPNEVPVAARCYRWFWGEKCNKPRRSTTNHWKFCSDECCDIMRKEVEAREANNKHHPTKGDTAPMSQPITEQDVAAYLEKFIQTSELVPDQMKALFIGRVTNWGNPVGAQPVAQDGTAAPAASAEVSRMGDAGTCGVSVIKEADNTFSIVIGDQKWPIANCGTIGHTIADGDEFQSAMKKVGEVNYRGFPGEFMLPTNAEMAYLNGIKEMAISRLTRLVAQCDKTSILACNIGKRLGRIVDEDDIQAIAARERLKLLNPESIPTAMTQMQKQERANFINSVAGFPRAPENK